MSFPMDRFFKFNQLVGDEAIDPALLNSTQQGPNTTVPPPEHANPTHGVGSPRSGLTSDPNQINQQALVGSPSYSFDRARWDWERQKTDQTVKLDTHKDVLEQYYIRYNRISKAYNTFHIEDDVIMHAKELFRDFMVTPFVMNGRPYSQDQFADLIAEDLKSHPGLKCEVVPELIAEERNCRTGKTGGWVKRDWQVGASNEYCLLGIVIMGQPAGYRIHEMTWIRNWRTPPKP